MTVDRELPAPLSARSTVLSLMLGNHPDPLTPAQLARAGQLFHIAAPTVRVAVARAAADGDLRRTPAGYELGERLVQRQRRQNEAVLDAEKEWDGSWELAVIVVAGRSGPERAALRDTLKAHRLAELREGTWTRPSNLQRPTVRDPVLLTFQAVPEQPSDELARLLWDIDTWIDRGTHLLEVLTQTSEPAARLAAAAAVVRHLSTDPLLPPALRARRWPAPALRAAYRAYHNELRTLLTTEHA